MAADKAFPIVGVGASAGGIEAIRQLLEALPPDLGMAFIIVLHMDPTHESVLAEILARSTRMAVTQVDDEPILERNHVYVIPPGRDMIVVEGHLKLVPRKLVHGVPKPVDTLFRSLAEDQTHRAIGVVLSGTGNDGVVGLASIRAEGGITFAQDETALHGDMPQNAVAGGSVDRVCSPRALAQELERIARHSIVAEAGRAPLDIEVALEPVLRVLRARTGVDFTNYRSKTIMRRIFRRMFLHRIETVADYLAMLNGHPAEVAALYEDILICVTSFFRDPEAYEVLAQKVFPTLVNNRPKSATLRVWVAGCSSGEEAYSLAIALAEFASSQAARPQVQVFATDLNENSIEKARIGIYPKSIAKNVSRERLERYFVETDGGFQICRTIRDMCTFATQNILRDPPFSRIDFISCRNLLIYLKPTLQRKILPLFHYAMNPNGFLLLGSSETVGGFTDLFGVVDRKHRIYFKQAAATSRYAPPIAHAAIHQGTDVASPRRIPEGPRVPDVLREADRIVLNRFAPSGVLTNSNYEVIQFRGDTGAYLVPPPGKPSADVLKMARPGLLVSLRAALLAATQTHAPERRTGIAVQSPGGVRTISLEVIPVRASHLEETSYLVLFADDRQATSRESEGASGEPPIAPSTTEEARDADMAQELLLTRDYLQSLIEQQEATNEELQSANEEIQSSNEELQSINEELQTSKEEMQASNEELATVNEELRTRNDELDEANSDLSNLFDSINEPVILLSADQSIRRFTPPAAEALRLSRADIGRPLREAQLPIRIEDLSRQVQSVIESGQAHKQDVEDLRGVWYSLRIRPYRDTGNTVSGAVILLVDIDSQRRAIDAIGKAKTYAELVIANAPTPLLVLDATLHVRTVSQTFLEQFGVSAKETTGVLVYELGNGQWNLPELRRLLEEVIPANKVFTNFEVSHEFERIGRRSMLLNARRLDRDVAEEDLILLSFQDVTDRAQATESLEMANRNKSEFLALLSHELRNPLAAAWNALELYTSGGRDAAVDSLAVMRRQLEKLNRLVSDLLDISRISRSVVELRIETVDLRESLKHVVDAHRHMMREHAYELAVHSPAEPVLVDGDGIRLEQIFGNLLRNAIVYTPPGGRLDIAVRRSRPKLGAPGEALFSVRDNGIGIEPEAIGHIFDLFIQGDAAPSRDGDGQGVGLYLVKQLVELHHGTVEARSDGHGRGAEFVVRLPLSTGPKKVADTSGKPKGARARSSPNRVLVIDDDTDVADMLSALLAANGYKTEIAYGGAQGLDAVESFRPDVVLVDIAMPDVDGFQFCNLLRETEGDHKPIVIALTGFGQEEIRARALESGANELLVKPITLNVLQSTVDALLPTR